MWLWPWGAYAVCYGHSWLSNCVHCSRFLAAYLTVNFNTLWIVVRRVMGARSHRCDVLTSTC